jgi:cytoskeletal protein CcmA (bactofilin family)
MTTIGQSLSITGEISSEEDLVIEGQVGGQIMLRNAKLTVGRTARVQADVRSARVEVLGNLRGNVAASERIELAPTAAVDGNLSANQVVLLEGATFNGRIDMDKRTIAAKVAHYKASQPA